MFVRVHALFGSSLSWNLISSNSLAAAIIKIEKCVEFEWLSSLTGCFWLSRAARCELDYSSRPTLPPCWWPNLLYMRQTITPLPVTICFRTTSLKAELKAKIGTLTERATIDYTSTCCIVVVVGGEAV